MVIAKKALEGMEKTTKKSVKKAASPKKIEEAAPKKAAPVAKKVVHAKKSEEPVKEVKKPVRKKTIAQKPVVEKPAEPKVEAVKAEVKEVKEIKEVKKEPVRHEPVVEPKKVVKAPVISKPSSTLAMGTGRRKEAVARVWLKLGKGTIMVNQQPYERYFDTQISRLSVITPQRVITKAVHYDVFANVFGGGKKAQAEAVRLGFVRALVRLNEEWRAEFRKAGLLTVDARQKERKKYGQRRARRKFQFVKR
jgi:small subunit ribosomal protein S9